MKLSELAIIAAQKRLIWGRWASARFAIKHGVPMRLYVIACQLEAAKRGGF